MNGVMTKQKQDNVAKRLHVSVLLSRTGWAVGVFSTVREGRVVPLYCASHDKYPPQRALSVGELLRRCWWQEDNRTPRARA